MKKEKKVIETDPTRPIVLKEIEKYEKLGEFDHHTDPVDMSITLPVDKNFKYVRKGFFDKTKVFFQRLFIVYPFARKQSKNLGAIVVGKEKIKGIKSAVLTCNHVNKFDCLVIQNAMMPKKTYVIGAEFNNMKGFFGEMMRVGGMLPLSSDFSAQKNLLKAVEYYLKKNNYLLVYPEQAMWWYYEKPRPFKDGAFIFAAKHNVPVIPMFITFRESGIFDDNGIEHKHFTLNIMDPIYPKKELSYRENVKYLMEENHKACVNKYTEVYGKAPEYPELQKTEV